MSRNLPPLRLLTVFEAVVRTGTVSTAAAELNVSQPAISQSLKALETHINARLLDRGMRPAGLTEAGALLHRATVDGLDRIAEAVEEIGRLNAGGGQAVTIACSVGFATYWLMPRLIAFYDRHPDIAVNVMTTHHGAPRLFTGVDLAIRYGHGKWEDGAVTHLFDERVDPVCSPALAERLAVTGTALADAPLIHVDIEDARWLTWTAYLRAKGQTAVSHRGLRFTNYVQATQAAMGDRGVMLGWRSITQDLVREGRLVALRDDPHFPDEAFHMVAAPRPRAPQACGIVARWLRETAQAQET